MKFDRVLKEVVWSLLTEGKISYRRIQRTFGLDHESLEALRCELIQAKRWATDEDGQFLVWAQAPLPALAAAAQVELTALRMTEGGGARAHSTEIPPVPALAAALNPPLAELRG